MAQSTAAALQFFETPEYPVGDAPIAIATGDFNGDGKPDLVLLNRFGPNSSDNTISVLLGDGHGRFPATPGLRNCKLAGSLRGRDFNGDGKLDVAVDACGGTGITCIGTGVVSILLGNGDGTFQAHLDYTVVPSPSFRGSIAAGDFNGDGKLDLVVANPPAPVSMNSVSILLGNGDGTFQAEKDLAAREDLLSVAVGDFNRDGKMDLAVVDYDLGVGDPAFINILLGNGDGTFRAPVSYATTAAEGVTVADLNGDGNADLVVTCGDVTARVLLGNGDGTFQSPIAYGTVVTSSFAPPTSPTIVDLNGDGKLDIVFSAPSENAAGLLLGNEDGTFGAELLFGTGSAPLSLAVADFNGDGKLDLATADSEDNAAGVLLGNGDDSFQARVEYAVQGAPGPRRLETSTTMGSRTWPS